LGTKNALWAGIFRHPSNIRLIKTLGEKPGEAMAYRNSYAIIGRYILAPEIFKGLDGISHSHQNSNIELTVELNQLALQQIVYAYLYKGDRQTISSILRRHLRDEIEKFLKHRGSPQG
jgi:UTP-glucose-1-phosphate uridylyltransferase